MATQKVLPTVKWLVAFSENLCLSEQRTSQSRVTYKYLGTLLRDQQREKILKTKTTDSKS